MEYVIIHEQFEINKKFNPENLIDEAVAGGLMNGNYDAIKSFKSLICLADSLSRYGRLIVKHKINVNNTQCLRIIL